MKKLFSFILLTTFSGMLWAQTKPVTKAPVKKPVVAAPAKKPVVAAPVAATQMAGDVTPVVQVPLTDGFARTGYELATIEARKQKTEFGSAEAAEKK